MNTFKVKVVTPDGEKYNGTPYKVSLRTLQGEIGILAHHTDYIAGVATCIVRITEEDGGETAAVCGGGFMTVDKGELTVICNTFEAACDIDESSLEDRILSVKEKIKNSRDKRETEVLKGELVRLELKEKLING